MAAPPRGNLPGFAILISGSCLSIKCNPHSSLSHTWLALLHLSTLGYAPMTRSLEGSPGLCLHSGSCRSLLGANLQSDAVDPRVRKIVGVSEGKQAAVLKIAALVLGREST